MNKADYIDLSNHVQPFNGLIPSFEKNIGGKFTIGKRKGATDYIEVIDDLKVRDYIDKNVGSPKYEGKMNSFDGFVSKMGAGPKNNEVWYM